ncbi:hypothetical protein HCN51_07545 [Nonomuraea sp. FMUSA5-5]|uniref:Uncharacterized protein n=1 Tax=Nonomuraea composti TaxID=2720023 RepID=A0ABX1B298_9ACTN|nr:hypothetical protein [Nonomuraea sp. FMUSA5-5]NJP89301.1 hypothetical protein [Nonomuraea sp. FMUSA5-5]
MLHPDLYLFVEHVRAGELQAKAAHDRQARNWMARDRMARAREASGDMARDWPTRDWPTRDWSTRDWPVGYRPGSPMMRRLRSGARAWGRRVGWMLVEVGLRLVARH